jgi:ATP-dependent RNA helicase RhlE
MKSPEKDKEENKEVKIKFSDLQISANILKVLEKLKLSEPTPIQEKAIPAALSGDDIIGVAQTGTGKTFAFAIPMIQRIALDKGQGMIIAPTRELASQVEESFKKLGTALGLKTAVLIGGEVMGKQLFQLRRNPHVIIATPGRLMDHLKRKTIKLDRLSVLVLDEADMMLDMGFLPQIKEILEQAPAEKQTMLFSATMPEAILRLAGKYMKTPISIEVAPQGTAAELVDQEIFIIKGEERFDRLHEELEKYKGSVLVFVRTKHGVKTLTMRLRDEGYAAKEIHSDLPLNKRKAALAAFKTGQARILVATDVAARGLDVKDIELVLNYNLPDSSEDYVHRIGRTGRAGKTGKAISFATPDQARDIQAIERLIGQGIKKTEFTKLERQETKPGAWRKRRPFRTSGAKRTYPAKRTGGFPKKQAKSYR